MSGVLVVAEMTDQGLDPTTYELVAAATGLEAESVVLLVSGPDAPGPEAMVDGVDSVVWVPVPAGPFDHEVRAAAVLTAVGALSPSIVIAGYTWRNAAFAAGVAVTRDLTFVADVVALERAVDGALLVTRPAHEGKALVELEVSAGRDTFLLVRAGSWAPAAVMSEMLDVKELTPSEATGRVEHVSLTEPARSGIDLTGADVILSLGRGVGEENIPVFRDLAERLGVTLGASRPIVDAGWLPYAHQVGQSGASVKPKLYIAVGISGALQHMVGIAGAQKVVAINLDREAPIFEKSDVGAVVDALEVAKSLDVLI